MIIKHVYVNNDKTNKLYVTYLKATVLSLLY